MHGGDGLQALITDIEIFENNMYASGVYRYLVDFDPSESRLEVESLAERSSDHLFMLKLELDDTLI